jgi:hypothetical protein
VLTQADSSEASAIRFADTSIPAKAHVGLAFAERTWSYPFFGSRLQHVVTFVPSTEAVPDGVDWLVVAPQLPAPLSRRWRHMLGTSGEFRVYRSQAETASISVWGKPGALAPQR